MSGVISAEHPRYVSQKTVHALKIARIEPPPIYETSADAARLLVPEDSGFAPIAVGVDWFRRHTPHAGGYLVTYPDGYRSYSPAAAFEAGNTPIEQYGLPLAQEPKYTIGERGRIQNRTTGKIIDDDEPLMIFRGKDRHARAAIAAYLEAVQSDTHARSVVERLEAFDRFAEKNPDRMREPDSI